MSLPRTIKTRLLEALAREAVACFSQAGLGLAERYSTNGVFRIHPYAVVPGDFVHATQVNVVVNMARYTLGAGGISDTEYDAGFTFLFLPDRRIFADGGNTPDDEIGALRRWLMSNGTAGLVASKNRGCIEDPDWSGDADDIRFLTTGVKEITESNGLLTAKSSASKSVNALFIDLLVTFYSREDADGNRVGG